MLIERMRRRLAADTKFIEPYLPSPADKPPSGSNWIHEIKHNGFRLMARRDPERTALWLRSEGRVVTAHADHRRLSWR
jgi:ATP-dependent DNA ligase